MNFSLKYLSYLINFTSTCYTHIEVKKSLNSDGQQYQYQTMKLICAAFSINTQEMARNQDTVFDWSGICNCRLLF
jgi:hypothetical protein